MARIDPQMIPIVRPMDPLYLEMYAVWEVIFDFTKADPVSDKPLNMITEQAVYFPPEIQAKHPHQRPPVLYEKTLRSPNFLMTAGHIRKRKNKKYGMNANDSVVSACSACLTLFCGAKPDDEHGHSISSAFTSAIRSKVSTDVDDNVYQIALCKLLREGGWASSTADNHIIPFFRMVVADCKHSGRLIPKTDTCSFSEKDPPVIPGIQHSDHTLEEPVIKLLESVFNQ
jgi:hypothetical protein